MMRNNRNQLTGTPEVDDPVDDEGVDAVDMIIRPLLGTWDFGDLSRITSKSRSPRSQFRLQFSRRAYPPLQFTEDLGYLLCSKRDCFTVGMKMWSSVVYSKDGMLSCLCCEE